MVAQEEVFINPRCACATRVTVVGFVILSVKRDLTSRMSNRAISYNVVYHNTCVTYPLLCGGF